MLLGLGVSSTVRRSASARLARHRDAEVYAQDIASSPVKARDNNTFGGVEVRREIDVCAKFAV